MANFYLYLFIIACLGLLGWGMIRLERAYQYPFFMGVIFVAYILPQAFALAANPGGVSPEGLSRVFCMSLLCAVMCWIGYQIAPSPKWLKALNVEVNEQKLLKAGIVLLAIGYFFRFLLGNTAIQTAGHSNGWTGAATIYLFFAQVIYIALAIFCIRTLKNPNFSNFILTGIAAYYPLQTILGGRRQPAMTFVIIIGLSFWFVKRSIPPKWFFILFIVVITILIPILAHNRAFWQEVVLNGDLNTLSSSIQNSTGRVLQGEVLELRNAAVMMEASTVTSRYGYGTGYWDGIVFQFFPGQIFGRGLKEALQFKLGLGHYKYLFGYSIVPGSTNTGIGDAFIEFNYFGCLVFAWMGYVFKTLWISANYHRSIFSILLYIGLISPAMVGITHGTVRFVQEGLFQLIFIGLTIYYSRNKQDWRISSSNASQNKLNYRA